MFCDDKKIHYAVIGDPVAHSLSPQMQNAGFEAVGLGSPYAKIAVKAEQLPEFVEFARNALSGFNITVPHKMAVIPFLDIVAPEAKLARSVNTVKIENGRLCGYSTDGFGLEAALHEAFGLNVRGGRFCFIGCGGAVQAAAFHFALNGAAALFFINRTVDKAAALAEQLAACASGEFKVCAPSDIASVENFLGQSQAAIQGTSLGLKSGDESPLPPELLPFGICLYETIYHPTFLLRSCLSRGMRCADGRTMLLYQGAKAFEIWTGSKAPEAAMRAALDCAIAAQNVKK